jgi:hypothetical protein
MDLGDGFPGENVYAVLSHAKGGRYLILFLYKKVGFQREEIG